MVPEGRCEESGTEVSAQECEAGSQDGNQGGIVMGFWDKDKIGTTESGVTTRSIREDRPRFKREYTAKLDDGRSIKITVYSLFSRCDRTTNGELTQSNGRWVLFDPKNIADKILDPNLVPLIEGRVAEILRLDANFMSNAPGEFVDEDGTTWQRT
jgi:hypothetical protein